MSDWCPENDGAYRAEMAAMFSVANRKRTEALTAERDDLKAKLAKAVEALERIASNEFAGVMLTSMPPQDAAAHFARTTLAELTGGKDE